MKLKYNNFLIIVPVFLILGIVLSIFNYTLEKNEIMWGLDSELESITKATAIFVRDNKDNTNIEKSLKKIIEYNRAKAITLIKLDKVIIDVKANEFDKEIKPYDVKKLSINELVKSDIYIYHDLSLIDAYIKIDNLNSSIVVTIEVSSVVEKLEEEYIEAIITTLIITLIGFLVSIILSIIVTYKIAEVSMMAQALSSGKYDTEFNFGKVKEFSDLGATLDIMKSILQEVLFKTRNSIMQEELFSKDNLLVDFYNNSNNKSSYLESEGIILNIKSLGDSGSFYHCFEDTKFIYSYFGTIEDINDKMTSTITSCGLSYYIHKIIEQNHTIDLDALSKEYNIKSLTIAIADKRSGKLNIQNLKGDDTSIDLNDAEVHILNNSHITTKVQKYISKYPNLTISEIADDISILFDEKDIFMIISKQNAKK